MLWDTHCKACLLLCPQLSRQLRRLWQGKDTVSFERFLHFKKTGGNHAHFNVIAVPPEAGHRAEATFQEAATREDITLQRVPGPSRVRSSIFQNLDPDYAETQLAVLGAWIETADRDCRMGRPDASGAQAWCCCVAPAAGRCPCGRAMCKPVPDAHGARQAQSQQGGRMLHVLGPAMLGFGLPRWCADTSICWTALAVVMMTESSSVHWPSTGCSVGELQGSAAVAMLHASPGAHQHAATQSHPQMYDVTVHPTLRISGTMQLQPSPLTLTLLAHAWLQARLDSSHPVQGDEARQGLRELVRDAEYFVTTLPSGARLAQVSCQSPIYIFQEGGVREQAPRSRVARPGAAFACLASSAAMAPGLGGPLVIQCGPCASSGPSCCPAV